MEDMMAKRVKKPKETKAKKDLVKKESSELKKQPQETNEDLQVGYAVELTSAGEFNFVVFGSDPGIVELMGLHKYAELRIQRLLEEKQITGDVLVHEVGKAVAALHQKIDKLLEVNKATNKLK